MARYNILDYGAKGDSKIVETPSIQKAIDTCSEKGGGVIYVPAGEYICGTIFLKSNISIELEHGATLVFNPNEDDFADFETLNYKTNAHAETLYFHFALFMGERVENIAIYGTGSIINRTYKRIGPKPIALKECTHVNIRDITIQHAPNYNISMLDCEYVNIDNVKLFHGLADGIDPDNSRNVRISNCVIETQDDAICLKASPALGRLSFCSDITVINCIIASNCNCFKCGTETSGDFRNIVVNNCSMHALPNGQHPLAGIALESVDGAHFMNVSISNISMVGVDCPIFLRLGNRGRAQQEPIPGSLENISISDIVATDAYAPILIAGIPDHLIKNVQLENITVNFQRLPMYIEDVADQQLDIPELENAYPEEKMFRDLPASCLFARHVENLVMRGLNMHTLATDSRTLIICDDCKGIDLFLSRFTRGDLGPVALEKQQNMDHPYFWFNNCGFGRIKENAVFIPRISNIKVTGELTQYLTFHQNMGGLTEARIDVGIDVKRENIRLDQ